jgi:hypothetical protein
MTDTLKVIPFDNCPALDGYHCQTNSLAKIYHFYNHPLSEDMLLGLGAGMGFIYWKMNFGDEPYIFIGGRSNNKGFFQDLGQRTGVSIQEVPTSSSVKAQSTLLEYMARKEPLMLFGDMGFLPWFQFPVEYHFGGHTFTLCGFDGVETLLASDIDPKVNGLKKGFYHTVTLAQLSKARNSPYKPFPPKNTFLKFDFSQYHAPSSADIYAAIHQTVESQLNPPIKNMGVKGLRMTASEIIKWPGLFNDHTLRMNLFNLYIFIEIGGTGGGCFRHMYARFLQESVPIIKNDLLNSCAQTLHHSGEILSEIGNMFKGAEHDQDITERIASASEKLIQAADLEEKVFSQLSSLVK